MRSFLNYFIFGVIADVAAVFINPYSYGSYDPAAENPAVYQYYARYYNPNPHNPYAPYPTHMKPGYFTLPRMYQIDPAYASRYPPNYAETLPLATYAPQGKISPRRRNPNLRGRESVAVFPDGCGPNPQTSGTEGNQAIFGQYRRRPSSIRRTMRLRTRARGRSHRRGQGRRLYPKKSETELLLERLDGKNGGGTKRKITPPPKPRGPQPKSPKSETELLLERLDRGGGVRPTPNPKPNGWGIQPKSETQLLLERLDRGGGWGTPKSETQILLERLDAGSNVFVTGNAYTNGISKNKYSRPRWIDTQPSPDVTSQFAAASGVVRPALRRSRVGYQRNTPLVDFPKDYESNRGRRPKYPDSSEATSSEQTSSEELSSSVETDNERPSDTERLPLDRVSDTHVTSRPETKTEKEDDVFSQITDGRTLRAVKRVRQ